MELRRVALTLTATHDPAYPQQPEHQLKPQQQQQQQQQEQLVQRKCHQPHTHNEQQTEKQQQQQQQQLQTKRTNHLIFQQQQTPKQQQQQQQLLPQQKPQPEQQQQHQQQRQPIFAQQYTHPFGQNENSTLQQQQKQTQKYLQQQQQKQLQQSQHQQLHHRWRTWATRRNVSNEISCSAAAAAEFTTATATITTTTTKTIVSTTEMTALAITATTKSIGTFLKRFSWLWLVGLICAAHATSAATPTTIITTNTATTKSLLPYALTAAATAAAVAAATVVAPTSAASVLIATTHQPLAPYQYPAHEPLLAPDDDLESEVELAERGDGEEMEAPDDAERALNALNSNEQQLLAYYRRAQYQQQQQQQQQHHHRQRAAPESAVVMLQQLVDFDEIVPTAGVVSTLGADEVSHGKRRVTKRSATTKTLTLAATTGPVAAAAAALTAPTTASTTTGSAGVAATASETTAAAEEKCEPKVLDEIPSEPYYDFTDIAEDAARQFTEFLASKFPASAASSQQPISDQLREEVRRRANGIASYALNEDENLLAFAIAAPSIHTVVVKFRDNVTIPPQQVHNKAFLGSYWRELGNAWNSTEGSQDWGAPFRDCNLLKGRWLWPFRISFTEYKIKIVAAAFIAADEDVCNDGLEEIFGRRHGCDRNTTFCLLTENKPAATRDVYTCICRESFYLPNSTLQGFAGDIVELSEGFDNYSCIPCPGGCSSCDQHGVCMFGEPQEVVSMESLLKVSVGSVLGACILCCIVLSVIVFQQRKCKAIASGMWTVLETILLGIVLLYASVAVHFFSASTERCLLEPWLRELGFITCYGAIILKLYRHLVDFRTRKAHRWVLRDVDLLKYLGTMVFAVVCYMAAFTASAQDLLETAQLETLREMRTNTCLPLKWDYVTQASEVLILCFGLHLSFASRNANTQFRERQFLVATLVLEFLVSATFYTLRFVYLPEMSPGAIFLALFVRSQLTNTIALGLIFVPKLWYQHKQVPLPMNLSIRLPVDAFKVNDPQRLGGGYAGLCLGDPDIGELTISEMSPEDIRAELKRLYTQLEILKNKTLRQDNPHISKRRGGRKAGHRRFSLQALSAKHRSNKHHQDIEITEAEPSRTPEDSVCSVEGPTDAEISGISHSMLSHSMVSHSMVSHSK